MENEEYDVVIVGSGIAGSVMAKVLTNAGKKVLILEAGLKSGYTKNRTSYLRNYKEYTNTFYRANAKVPNSPYPNLKNAPSPDVLADGQIGDSGYLIQKGPVAFGSDCLRAPGGTTLHWLGSTPRMIPNDFKMQSRYKKGVDWPFSYEDLVPYYEMAELEIGVSGTVKGQTIPGAMENHYGDSYQFPMKEIPQTFMDKTLIKNFKKSGFEINMDNKQYQVQFVNTPQGRNSNPNPDYPYLETTWIPGKGKTLGYLKLTNEIFWNPSSGKIERVNPPLTKYQPLGSIWDPDVGTRCEGNSSCVPICPVQAKYNAHKSLQKSVDNKLTILFQAVATKVTVENGRISGILYKQYLRDKKPKDQKSFYETKVAKGTIYILAASALENAKILLSSDKIRYSNNKKGVPGNSSDQVGRNLMDHITKLGWGLLKEGKLFPFRGPGSTTHISTFRDGDFRMNHAACILPLDNWGWGWPALSPYSDVVNAVDSEGLYGKCLRDTLSDRISRQLLIHFECEQLPDPNNRIEIHNSKLDPLGNPRPVIHFSIDDYSKKALVAFDKVQTEIFRKMGVEDYTENNNKYHGTGHITGTHRMGNKPEDSVVDQECRSWDHKNLFLVGCGSMPTIGTSNPTLTMTAVTFKSAEAVLNQLDGKFKKIT